MPPIALIESDISSLSRALEGQVFVERRLSDQIFLDVFARAVFADLD